MLPAERVLSGEFARCVRTCLLHAHAAAPGWSGGAVEGVLGHSVLQLAQLAAEAALDEPRRQALDARAWGGPWVMSPSTPTYFGCGAAGGGGLPLQLHQLSIDPWLSAVMHAWATMGAGDIRTLNPREIQGLRVEQLLGELLVRHPTLLLRVCLLGLLHTWLGATTLHCDPLPAGVEPRDRAAVAAEPARCPGASVPSAWLAPAAVDKARKALMVL